MTQLGATNVQGAAPQVRDILEKGVADAVTFPWGSVVLFGVDKVTKYHMEAPLYVTTFAYTMNKGTYDRMSVGQKKVIDDHCTTDWAGKIAGRGPTSSTRALPRSSAGRTRGLFDLGRAARRVAQVRRAADQHLVRQRQERRRQSGRRDEGASGPIEEIHRVVLTL